MDPRNPYNDAGTAAGNGAQGYPAGGHLDVGQSQSQPEAAPSWASRPVASNPSTRAPSPTHNGRWDEAEEHQSLTQKYVNPRRPR